MKITAWLDFWTSNSTIGYSNWVNNQLIELGKWKTETRTVLFASEDEKKFIIWDKGISHLIEWDRWRLIQSPKSYLNSAQEIMTVLLWKNRNLSEVVSIIIKDFKSQLENILIQEVESVVIWRPVKFHDSNQILDKLAQDRLEQAARLAWFKNVEFQLEPLAAANSCKENMLRNQSNEKTIMIADLWWWTSDFSIVNIWKNVNEILWNNWIYIWWNSLDFSLSFNYFSSFLWKDSLFDSMSGSKLEVPVHYFTLLSTWKLLHTLSTQKNIKDIKDILRTSNQSDKLSRLLEIVEDHYLWYEYFKKVEWVKVDLSSLIEVNGKYSMFKNPFDYNISRNQFEDIIWDDVSKIFWVIDEILLQSGLTAENIDIVFMTGWTSLVPLVVSWIENKIWKWKLFYWNTFTSVWHWLVLEAKNRFL